MKEYILVLIYLFTCITQAAIADTFIRLEHHKPATDLPGFAAPAMTDTILVWLGDGKARIDLTSDRSTLYEATKDEAIDVYWRMEIFTPRDGRVQNRVTGVSDGATDLSAGIAELSPQIVSTVTETEQHKTINGYDCQLWIQRDSMPQMEVSLTTEVWACEDIKADQDLYYRIIEAPVRKAGLEQSFAEHRKVRGIPVLSTTVSTSDSTGILSQMIGTTFRLISCEEVEVQPGHYDVPEQFERFPGSE